MIIATLPLAGLLVWQILESLDWVGETNVLLAKNILWWFGHPVVYLLLFPAVAVYYWLIPRYAGRDLVAGHVIAIAWTIAVIANVFVWAHHLYLDYPSGTPQAQINTAMQPITFALVLPSALSLYSLALHDLPLAVPLDARVDGALLRARRLAARRALGHRQRDDRARRRDPQHALDRRPLPPHGDAQHRPADLRRHVRAAARALRQGALQREARLDPRVDDVRRRDGRVRDLARPGPRRRAAALGGAAVAVRHADPRSRCRFVFLLAAAQALFFWNVLQTLRGKAGVATFDERGIPVPAAIVDRLVGARRRGGARAGRARCSPAIFAVGGYLVGREHGEGRRARRRPADEHRRRRRRRRPGGRARMSSPAPAAAAATRSRRRGRPGTVGPSLDAAKPSEALVIQRVTNGMGAMPPFDDQLSAQQIADVAAYVHASTSK